MAAPKFEVLEQATLTVDDVEYLVTALPATKGLQYLEVYRQEIDSGKADLTQIKQILCPSLGIDEKKFDIKFARKYGHLHKLYRAVLNFNFDELFQTPDTEE
jgi:hypothetical protein